MTSEKVHFSMCFEILLRQGVNVATHRFWAPQRKALSFATSPAKAATSFVENRMPNSGVCEAIGAPKIRRAWMLTVPDGHFTA